MLIIKNALSNIGSAKGRNILIGIIVLVIAVSSCISLAVKQSAKKAEENGLENLSVSASISYDREKLRESGTDFREQLQNVQELTLDEMQAYAESEYVKEFRYTTSSAMNGGSALEAIGASTETESESAPGGQGMPGQETPGGGKEFAQGDVTITGYSDYSAMTDFVSGRNKIEDGEMFEVESDAYECIISAELAAYNNLKAGDTIQLTNPNNEEQVFTFTITGTYTYTESDSEAADMKFSSAMDAANQVYTSEGALNSVVSFTVENAAVTTDSNGTEQSTALMAQTNGTYIFSDADDYNAFTEDVKTMGLGDEYTVTSTDLTNYENSLVPIKNTAKFADMMLWIILGVGSVILIVLNIFNIRERKYEVGVLTAIGMKKSKVALQFVAELLLITVVAIAIGTGIGAVLSVPVSNTLLESQISAQETQSAEQSSNFGGMPMGQQGGKMSRPGEMSAVIDYVSTLNASVDLPIVGQLMGLGLLLTIAASFAAVIFVMRYEPLKILSERS